MNRAIFWSWAVLDAAVLLVDLELERRLSALRGNVAPALLRQKTLVCQILRLAATARRLGVCLQFSVEKKIFPAFLRQRGAFGLWALGENFCVSDPPPCCDSAAPRRLPSILGGDKGTFFPPSCDSAAPLGFGL